MTTVGLTNDNQSIEKKEEEEEKGQ